MHRGSRGDGRTSAPP